MYILCQYISSDTTAVLVYSEISYRNCKENEVLTNFTISIRSTHLTTFVQNIFLHVSAICMSLSLNIFSWSPNRILLFHYYSFLSLFSFHFLFSSFFFLSGIFFLIFLSFSFTFFFKYLSTGLSTHTLYKMYNNMCKLISINS